MSKIFKQASFSDEIVILHPFNHPEIIEEKNLDQPEAIKEEAFQSGFEQGYVKGAAFEKSKMAELAQALQALLESIPQAIGDNRKELSSEIADIVLLITQQYWINQQNKNDVALQINQIISKLNDKQHIELHLHPQDIQLLQQGLLHIDSKSCPNLTIVADEQLRLGGCIVKSSHGTFDASIERQIDNLKEYLLKIRQGALYE